MQQNRMTNLRCLTTAAVFAAAIFVSTYFLHIPTPLFGGYVHPGDTFIYLAGCFLPTPYAMAAASIGAALSDALTPNAAIYVPATIVIKALLSLYFTSKSEKILTKRHIAGIFLAGITGLAGYFVWESIIFRSVPAALFNAMFGALQPVMSGIFFVLLGLALDKTNIKRRFKFG